MLIYTLWERENDKDTDIPWIVEAVDEYTIDNNCEFPADYLKKRESVNVREMVIDVPEDAVRNLFDSAHVKATVKP